MNYIERFVDVRLRGAVNDDDPFSVVGYRAVYRCTDCGCERQYGCAPPPVGDNYKPLIRCRLCKSVQRHYYVEMRSGWVPQ